MATINLYPRWQEFCRRLGVKNSSQIQAAYRKLAEKYAESHRKYHTFEHIAFLLKEFSPVRCLARNPEAVEAAIWFHDAIYEIGSRINEEESAWFARCELGDLGCAEQFGLDVVGLILWTKHKDMPPEANRDAQLLVSLDLLSLSLPLEDFMEHTKQIREEQRSAVPNEAAIIRGQVAFLNTIFDREAVYPLASFEKKYGKRAKSNIEYLFAEARYATRFAK